MVYDQMGKRKLGRSKILTYETTGPEVVGVGGLVAMLEGFKDIEVLGLGSTAGENTFKITYIGTLTEDQRNALEYHAKKSKEIKKITL